MQFSEDLNAGRLFVLTSGVSVCVSGCIYVRAEVYLCAGEREFQFKLCGIFRLQAFPGWEKEGCHPLKIFSVCASVCVYEVGINYAGISWLLLSLSHPLSPPPHAPTHSNSSILSVCGFNL